MVGMVMPSHIAILVLDVFDSPGRPEGLHYTRPEAARSLRFCRALLLLEQRLAAQADLAGRVDVDDLYQNLLAFLQLVANVFHTVVRDLRHVQEAIGARHYLDERAEVGDALDLAEVGFVQLWRSSQLLDDRDRLLSRRLVRRRDVHPAVVLD